jgi:hypothetical protein
MMWVTTDAMAQLQQGGQLLVHEQTSGHVYGISTAEVRRLQGQGCLPIVALDRVDQAVQLRASCPQVTVYMSSGVVCQPFMVVEGTTCCRSERPCWLGWDRRVHLTCVEGHMQVC